MTTADADQLIDPAIALVRTWLDQAAASETKEQGASMEQLRSIVTDDPSVAFVMSFVDRVVRPEANDVAAHQMNALMSTGTTPGFLSAIDRTLLRVGALLAPKLPAIVMPLARRRMRAIVGQLVAPAEPALLQKHLEQRRSDGFALNVNLLGESVLGEREATRRLDELLELLDQPDVDYVSVKISAVASQLNHFAHEASLGRVRSRLRTLVAKAAAVQPATFLNFDMEEYHDLDLTLTAFMDVLGEPEFHHVEAGIVLQAYLPDALGALQQLTEWAQARHENGGAEIKVRLVKGANLAMEKVDAAIHNWEQAPYESKHETDANYKRCVDWLLQPERMTGVRLGLASHNLFDVAWAHLLAQERGVADRVQFEMLKGMAPAQAEVVARDTNGTSSMLLYTPIVRSADFDVAISYLFRRLEENAADDNFLRHLFDLAENKQAFERQAQGFADSVAARHDVSIGPRRQQNRSAPAIAAYQLGEEFRNEPDTDPTLPANQAWIHAVATQGATPVQTPLTTTVAEIDAVLTTAHRAQELWAATPPRERQQLLHRIGDELANRRGDLITTMMHEANKAFEQADVEISEGIDFARWYGDRALELDFNPSVTFTPLGVVAVVPPWNFPMAIPAGGVLSSLAAGNAVIFKPAPETPRTAEIVAEACWAAGTSPDLLQFVRTPDNEVGQHLVTQADGVILTGSTETAALFQSWKPDIRLFAETSGKNALIITPNADLDLAVADLVQSAFGHSGQKCSAASLAIAVGSVYKSERFRRQLADAVNSLDASVSTDLEANITPLVGGLNDRLARGLRQLDAGEQWLVEPQQIDAGTQLWSPGVRIGVTTGSWFHQTECFGPVLGVMYAPDLATAIEMQNATSFGLTGGIHTLDPAEVDQWIDTVQVGNAYVNRAITGAIVQRQPFGGWKRSTVGPGAKAGGVNYVAQLGTWSPTTEITEITEITETSAHDYAETWRTHFAKEHDETGLFCEANIFRYRPQSTMVLRTGPEATPGTIDLVRQAATIAGVTIILSGHATETQAQLAERLPSLNVERVRMVGETPEESLLRVANEHGIHLASQPVTAVGRLELQHWVREQAVSRTLHRFGNLVGVSETR